MGSRFVDSAALPAQHLRLAMRWFGHFPDVAEKLMEGTGVDLADLNDPGFSLPATALLPLLENATTRLAPGWFLNLPVLWSIEVQSEFGLAMRVASNLAEAIDVLEQFWSARWPIAKLKVTRGKSGIQIALVPMLEYSSDTWRDISILGTLNFQTTLRSIIDQKTRDISYRFNFAKPSFADHLTGHLDGQISWDNAVPSLFISASLLATHSPYADREVFLSTVESLRRMAALRAETDLLSPRVRNIVLNIPVGQLTAEKVAGRLGITRRSLERKLGSEGTAFKVIADSAMRTRFEALLSKAHMTAEDMATQLGYHDGSSVMRACRRLFGQSLSELRAAKRKA